MDQRTLIVSCVEYYSYLKNIPSNLVFQSFERTDLMPLLLDTQRQFPDMDLQFYMGMIDGITSMANDAKEDDYSHYEERTALVPEVVSLLQKAHKMDDIEACRMYYQSKTAGTVSEEKTGWYQKTPQEIFALVEAE